MRGEQKMNLNLNFIKRNSMQVYNILSHYTRCTFAQLDCAIGAALQPGQYRPVPGISPVDA